MKKILILIVLYFMYGNIASAAPMTFTDASQQIGGCYVGCQWIAAEGEITKETPDILRKFLAGRKPFFEVAFNSQGGDIFAAMEVGRILNQYKATVYVGKTYKTPDYLKTGKPNYDQEEGQCLEACVFAYLGGWKRLFYSDYLAFTPYQSVLNNDEERGLSVERQQKLAEITRIDAYAKEMHFDPDFIYLGYGKEAAHRLDENEVKKYNIQYNPKEFGPWAFGIENNKLFARTQSRNGEEQVTIACKADSKTYLEWRMAADRGNDVNAMNKKVQNPDVSLWFLGQKLSSVGAHFYLDKNLMVFSQTLGTFQPDDLQNGYVVLTLEGLEHFSDMQMKTDFADYASLKTMVPMVMKNCLKQ